MSSFFGIGNSSDTFMNTMFGTSSSNRTGSSLSSSLGDLKMIQSGVYKKALQAYYEKNGTEDAKNTIANSGSADTNAQLSSTKSSSKKLADVANELKTTDFATAKSEDVIADVKDFVSNYNSTLNSAKKLNSYSILQTSVWMKEQTDHAESMLDKIGITIGADNTLTIDEDKLKAASMTDIKSVFGGSSSYGARVAIQASSIANQSGNQMALNMGKNTYNMNGYLN